MKKYALVWLGLWTLTAMAGCSKQEQRQAETKIDRAGDTAARTLKNAGKTAVNSLDKAGETTVKTLDKAGDTAVKTLDKAAVVTGDAAVTGSVKTRLLADKWVDATKVDVSTKNKAVLLLGSVPTAQQKVRAGQIAQQTSGVRKVLNRLRVQK